MNVEATGGMEANPPRIMIVSHEQEHIATLQSFLEGNGYPACFAQDADQAGQLLESFSPDIALIDISGKKKEGLGLIAHLSKNHPDILSVGLTDPTGTKTTIEAVHKGVFDFLVKPIRKSPLKSVIKRCLEKLARERENEAVQEALHLAQFSIDRAPDAIYWVNPDASFSLVNEAACISLGYSREELLGMTVHDVDPNITAESWRNTWETIQREGSMLVPSIHIRKSGERFPIEVSANYVRFRDKEYNCAIVRDISDRTRSDQRIRENEARLKLAQEIAHLGYWERDLQSGLVILSEETFRIFGIDPKTFPGTQEPFFRILHPDDRERVRKMTISMEEGAASFDHEYRIVMPTGEVRYVHGVGEAIRDETGKSVRIFGTILDITERKRAEENSLAGERLLATVFDTVPHWLFVKDPAGCYLRVNRSMAEFFHLNPENFVQKRYEDNSFSPGSEADESDQADRDVMDGNEPVDLPHLQIRDVDGSLQFRHVIKLPLRNEEGQAIGVVGISQDITERKIAEDKLRESEERFRNLIEGSIQGIYVHREFKHLFVNKACAYTLGYASPEDFLEQVQSLEELVHPAERKRLRKFAAMRLKGEAVPDVLETRFIHRNGSSIWVELVARLIDWEGKPAIQATFNDITERKQAEEALRTSERIMAKAQQVAHLGSMEWDLVTQKQYWSDEVYRIMGLEPQSVEASPKAFADSLHSEDKKKVLEAIDNAVWKGHRFNVECRVVLGGGKIRVVHGQGDILRDEEGNPLRMIGTVQDITERKQAEEELKASRQLLQTVFDTIPIAVYVKNLEGKFILANQALAKNLGYRLEDLIGKEFKETGIGNSDEIRRAWETDRRVMEKGESIDIPEETLTYPGGDIRWRHTIKTPLRDPRGTIIGLVGVREDITDRKRTEDALRDSEQRFRDFAESSADWFWEMDADLRFTYMSPNVERSIGFPPEWYYGKTRKDLLGPEYDHDTWGRHLETLEQREAFRDFTYRWVGKDSETEWLSTSGKPIFDEDGKFRGYRGTGSDITELMQAQEDLEISRKAERQAHTRLLDALESLLSSFTLYDAQGKLVLLNRKTLEMFPNLAPVLKPGNTYEDLLRYTLDKNLSGIPPGQQEVWMEDRLREYREGSDGVERQLADGRWLSTYQRPTSEGGVVSIRLDITERKKAEQALRESRDQLRLITDNLPVLITFMDEENRFQFMNRTAERWYDCAAEDWIGHTAREVFPDSSYDTLKPQIQSALSGKLVNFEDEIEYPDGNVRFVNITYVPHISESGRVLGYFGLVADISKRKMAEKELLSSQKLLQTVFDLIPHALFVKDTESRYLMVNQAAVDHYGIATSEYLGQKTDEVKMLIDEDLEKLIDLDRKVIDSGKRVEKEEFPVSLPNGEKRILRIIKLPFRNEAGEVEGLVSVAENISTRKRAEQALKESEELFRSIVEYSPSAISLKDLEGRFQLVNRRYEEWYGHSGKELQSMTSHDHFPAHYANLYVSMDKEVLHTGKVIEEELDVPFANGTVHALIVTKFPVLGKDDLPIGVGTISTDVTGQRSAELQLRQAQRLEALGTLAGGIAHDLNNILFPIIGYSEVLMKQHELESQTHSFLEIISSSAIRAKDLVSQILLFSRTKEGKRDLCHLKPVAMEVVKLIRSTLPASIKVEERIARKLELVNADPSQIHQVMMNLCINAGQAMPDGGTLRLSLDNVDLKEASGYLGEKLTGPYVRIACEDTGEGMDEGTIGRIFEPFFTTKGVGKGTGLGLSTVFGIVQQHEGAMNVTSTPGEGTLFEVYLPAIQFELEPSLVIASPVPQGSESILFVDDEETIVGFARMVLENQGYKVVGSSNSLEALNIFKADPSRFDLVVSDFIMPNMTGDQFTKEIRRLRPDIPVVLSTGNKEALHPDSIESLGIDQIIYKPIGSEELLRIVREVLDRETAVRGKPEKG